MNNAQKCFLKLLNNGIHNKSDCVDCNLEELEKLAKTHICIPYIYIGAKNAGLMLPDSWKNYITLNSVRNQLNLQVQSNIIKELKENNIPCAVIKGSTVAVNYNEPLARTLGDVDILVSVDDYDRALEILCGDKYKDESSKDHKFHYRYTTQGITVEIHKYVAEYSSEKYGKIILDAMDKALDSVVLKRIDEFEFPSLSNEYQAATLLLHTQRHFYENLLPMRMLCDWAMFVKSVDFSEWNEKVYPFIQKLGLNSLCDVLTAVCNKYLELGCDEKVKSIVDDRAVEYMISEFLDGGISKDEKEISQTIGSSYSQYKTTAGGSIKPLLLLLNRIARNEYSLARLSPVFLPLFWIYIPVRFIFRTIIGTRKSISFNSFSETSKRKEYLIKKLKLKE